MPRLWNTVYALLLSQFPVKTGRASTGQVLRRGSDQTWQLWVRDFLANSAKHPKQEEGGERDVCTVLVGLPTYPVTFRYANREYEIISELSRSHFRSIFQRMTLYVILEKAYFEISTHTWDSGASLLLRESQNDPCNVQNILKIFFRKHISVLRVWNDKSPPGTHPRLASSL